MCERDRELLDQLAFDPEQIAKIVALHGPRLLGRLHAFAKDRGLGNVDVDDVFQDTLLQLFKPEFRQSIVDSGGCILPYLTKHGYWRLQTLGRRRHDSLEALDFDPEDRGAGADQRQRTDQDTDQAEDANAISAARAARDRAWWRLSQKDRDLLERRYFESYTERELAVLYNTTEAAMKKALADARRRFRALMDDEGFDVEE